MPTKKSKPTKITKKTSHKKKGKEKADITNYPRSKSVYKNDTKPFIKKTSDNRLSET